jgi:hypothetical protein
LQGNVSVTFQELLSGYCFRFQVAEEHGMQSHTDAMVLTLALNRPSPLMEGAKW